MPSGTPAPPQGGIIQFWARPIMILVVSVILFAVLARLAWSYLSAIPRDAFESMATIEATLLGLTFTAFSVLSTFMPGLRRDFVRSHTFLTLGKTFVLTMGVELVAFVLAWLSFLVAGSRFSGYVGPAVALVMLVSVGLVLTLISDMFSLFKMARAES